ncbi:MAG TPA: prepilin-type N-terminal cleavage/methylation domain-containing protein [Candidatus Saccharimonadales bacterium]|nr:prepilin-type N-terminal cleavage/methylation domain-containing protein [Candidatus Saccharimonadales bacterium]
MINYQKGQTLIETLSAIAILSIVIVAIATSVTSALSNTEFNQNQTLATKYAQQGSEIVNQIRDTSYVSFLNYTATNYCLAANQTALTTAPQAGCPVNISGVFIRSVQITQNGCVANVAKVTVSVAFTDGKCTSGTYCHVQSDTSCLSTTNPVQSP